MDEHYHSVNGARQESEHVYIEAGLNQCDKTHIQVLEMGFGTGLNALLTWEKAREKQLHIHYTSLEKYPLSPDITDQLNYGDKLRALHACKWNNPVSLDSHFSIHKIETDFNDYAFAGHYDVVYYDAFAPDKQEEVWNQNLFDRLFASMNAGGILTTYCAKGEIRRRMKTAGFTVERIPGPPGKREMLRAIKPGSD